jgi:tetratricopeptide (TPR) repeat protein
MRGLHHLNKRNAQSIRRALDYFSQATERDSSYALAFSGVATCNVLMPMYASVPPETTHPRAKAAARKAIELDNRIAEPHAILGISLRDYDWDWAGAEREFRTAISLNPNYAPAHVWYGETLLLTRSPEIALAEFQTAQLLEPASLLCNTQLGMGLYLLRRYDEAIDQLKRTLELDPTYIVTHLRLMYAYLKKTMFNEAIVEAQRVSELNGDKRDVVYLALTYGMAGKPREAQGFFIELQEVARREFVSYERLAAVYMALGDKAQAIRMLERGVELKHPRVQWLIDPLWDPLRTEPDFRALQKKLKLPS